MAADCRDGKDDPAPGSKRPAEGPPSDTASDAHPNGGANKLPRTSPDKAEAATCANGDAAAPAEAQKEDPAAAEVAKKRAALQAAKKAALEAAKRAALEALESTSNTAAEAPNGNSSDVVAEECMVADLSIVEVLKRESESAIGQVLDANARPGAVASAGALIYETPRDPLARSRVSARESTALVPTEQVPTLTPTSGSPPAATSGEDSAIAPTTAKAATPTLPPDMPAGARLASRAVGAWAWGDGPGGVSFARPRQAPRSWQNVANHGGAAPRTIPRPVRPVGPVVPGGCAPRTIPNPAGAALRGQFRPAPKLPSSRPGLGYNAGM